MRTWASPRRKGSSPKRKGPPRGGDVCLGEPEDGFCGVSGPPRRSFASLGEPLRLGEGRLHLGKPMTMLRPVFMAC